MGTESLEQVTLLVHGTFANPGYGRAPDAEPVEGEPESWWLRTEGDGPATTADHLHGLLRELDPDAAAALWTPGADERDGDLDHDGLGEWSGLNTHRARIRAARTMATRLDELATRRGCDEGRPLLVNFVAHSHGGNVVLEALRHLTPRVRPRQVCMLGTPLTWRFADPRVLYLAYLFSIFVLIFWATFEVSVEMWLDPAEQLSFFDVLGLSAVSFALFAPLILWTAVGAITLARWGSGLLTGAPAYGPRPEQLQRQLAGRPAVLFISAADEADLMLQLGAAPMDAYRALVRGQPSLTGVVGGWARTWRLVVRVLELAYLRPLAYATIIPMVEIVLERFGLGFPLRSVLFRNHEMVTWTGARTYTDEQITTTYVTDDQLSSRSWVVAVQAERIPPASKRSRRPGTEPTPERVAALRTTLLQTLGGLRRQVQLQHSSYYESDEIVRAVALQLVA